MQSNYFTCIGKGHGAPAIPATMEAWQQLRNEQWLKDMCERIEQGDETLKNRLPIWTPSCAEFKNNHRAVKDATKPLRRLMLDFDQKGHSQEILERCMQLREAGKWNILLVEESVRRGTHVLITLPTGMTPQEAQAQFSEEVGFQADPALKDVSRCIYMVPTSHTLWVSEQLGTIGENDVLEATQDLASASCENVRELPTSGTNIPTPAITFPPLEYPNLVSVLEEQMGGRPAHGSRNNFIFSMACHLRYVCNDDPHWIASV
ncbi:MAG: hypothetical protein J6S02_01190, partial [Bacteroidaceae bacterium]|nr:hypothetical protein [Bacteroidaceae bacterium]